MWITLDFSELYLGAGIAVLAALLGTPLLWRLGAPLPRPSRTLLTTLGCLGLSGLIALPITLQPRLDETALFALLGSAALQALAVPILLLLPHRS
jgi:hypothetical protein